MRALLRIAIALCIIAPAANLAAPRQAYPAEAVAVVLTVSGFTQPELAPYSEISDGQMIQLRAGARLTFLHCRTCTRVTVNGGTVTVGTDGYELGGGAYQSREHVPCPVKMAVVAAMDAPMTLERGDARDSMLTLAPGAAFVVMGEGARGFTAVRLVQNDAPVREVKLRGSNFRWADATAGIAPGSLCTLEFERAGGKPVRIKFRTGPQSAGAADVFIYVR
jgi:hypothetical protein